MSEAVKTAFAMNVGICVIKTVAAFITGSPSMAAEAVHSGADSGNQILLMHGNKRSKKTATAIHPFGFGKEQYFWAFVVAMLLFVLGGLYSLYEGIHKIIHPEPVQFIIVNLVILGISFLLEGKSWLVAKKEMDCDLDEMFDEVVESKDASTVVVFVEDTGALLGLGLAFIGTIASAITGNPIWDAISSIAIGTLLFVTAFFLANEMRKLQIGESINPVLVRYIRMVMNHDPNVLKIGKIKTMQMGSESCLVAVKADFRHDLHDHELEEIIEDLEAKILIHVPEAENNIFIHPKRMTE